MIHLRTLGSVELLADGNRPVRALLGQPKRLILLTWLTTETDTGGCRRDTVLGLFWPELRDDHARGALRQALRFLRKSLGPDIIEGRGDEPIGIRIGAIDCDAVALQRAHAAGELEQAAELYRGEFLPGHFASNAAPELDDWLSRTRERLRELALEAARTLAKRCQLQGELTLATHWARRGLAIGPDDEESLRILIRALGLMGDRTGAMRAYENFARALARHYNVEPERETRELIHVVRAGQPNRETAPNIKPLRRKRIAVLPFVNVGGNPANDYLCHGFTDDLMQTLARIEGLHVASRAESFAVSSEVKESTTLRDRLGVGAVLEGTLRRVGARISVTARLTDLVRDKVLWSQDYDYTMRDIFVVRETITRAVTTAVGIDLTFQEALELARRPTGDPDAYDLYLKGRHYWRKRPRESLRALEILQRATARDPRFALAHAALADVYNTLGSWEAGVLPSWEAFPKAQAAALKAMAIEPDLAEAHTSLAYAATHYLWQWDLAEQQFERAIGLNPNYAHAHHWHSHYLMAVGRVAESMDASRRALELEPADVIINVHMAWHHWLARDYEAAIEQAERTCRLDERDHWPPFFRGLAASHLGMHSVAIDAQRRAFAFSSGSPVMRAALGYCYAAAGERRQARAVLKEMEKLADMRVFSYETALIRAVLGDRDAALDRLARAREERSGWLAYINIDPRWDVMRDDARFGELVRSLGFKAL
jgi:TolB-like protein/Flp pilus assembly protein TadD